MEAILLKRFSIVFILLLLFSALMVGISYAISPDEQAQIFAEEYLLENKKIVESALVALDYSTAEDAAEASLGEEVRNYTISIEDFDPSKKFEDQIKQMPFYNLPVMVKNEVITDYTVALINGNWEHVDIGGNLCKHILTMAEENGISPKNVKVLRFGGQTFLFADTDKEVLGYSPYFEDVENKIQKGKTFSGDILKKQLSKRQKEYNEFKKHGTKGAVGGSGFGAYPPLNFNQNNSVFSRLIKYVEINL